MTISRKQIVRDIFGPGTTGGPISRSIPNNDRLAIERGMVEDDLGAMVDLPTTFKFSEDYESALGYDPDEHTLVEPDCD